MTDEALVAAELAALAPFRGQQAQAEAMLLAMLPAAEAARILRDEIAAALAHEEPPRWGRYLQLEDALIRFRGGDPLHRLAGGLWCELNLGEEPEPLQFIRRRRGIGWPEQSLWLDLGHL